MQQEIEVKFLDIAIEDIRTKLKAIGGVLEQPMRMMRRKMYDYPDRSLKARHARLRVRDEGHIVTMTYKASGASQYDNESETTVGSFDDTCQLLEAIGLQWYSYQESKRETWHLQNGTEVVIDEWPWLPPYIEIEATTESAIRDCAIKLGFDWDRQAVFGDVDQAYKRHYPKMKSTESCGENKELVFGGEMPEWFRVRQA